MTDSTRAWLQMHFCVLLWGFTAILGRAITLPALPLVWLRMLAVTVLLALLPGFWRGLLGMPLRMIGVFAGIGVLVTAHWITFYASIKMANASVAATCMALTPVFVAFVEPLLVRRRFDIRELFFGLAIVPGVALVVGGTPSGMRVGIVIGVLSAFFAAVFSSLNKRYIRDGSALAVTGLEMAAGAVCLSFIAPWVLPGPRDAVLLLILAIGCTLVPFALSLVALRHMTVFSASLAVNLEPVYSIILAVILLGEQRELTLAFYLGVAVIVGGVFGHSKILRLAARAES